jgi:asparagine synthase (glutamine-hydrolysing)
MLDADINTYLPDDLLVKMDIATMAYSVEGRSPFLDHQLMEFAASLPPQLKMHGGSGKILLKSALRGVLPDEILDRRKMGFGVPLGRWFREELRDLPREVLMGTDARVHAYVKPSAIAQMIQEHQDEHTDHSLRLWVLLQLELWHREVVESPLISDSSIQTPTLIHQASIH